VAFREKGDAVAHLTTVRLHGDGIVRHPTT